jgi:hypothetical protein
VGERSEVVRQVFDYRRRPEPRKLHKTAKRKEPILNTPLLTNIGPSNILRWTKET